MLYFVKFVSGCVIVLVTLASVAVWAAPKNDIEGFESMIESMRKMEPGPWRLKVGDGPTQGTCPDGTPIQGVPELSLVTPAEKALDVNRIDDSTFEVVLMDRNGILDDIGMVSIEPRVTMVGEGCPRPEKITVSVGFRNDAKDLIDLTKLESLGVINPSSIRIEPAEAARFVKFEGDQATFERQPGFGITPVKVTLRFKKGNRDYVFTAALPNSDDGIRWQTKRETFRGNLMSTHRKFEAQGYTRSDAKRLIWDQEIAFLRKLCNDMNESSFCGPQTDCKIISKRFIGPDYEAESALDHRAICSTNREGDASCWNILGIYDIINTCEIVFEHKELVK